MRVGGVVGRGRSGLSNRALRAAATGRGLAPPVPLARLDYVLPAALTEHP